MPALKWLGEKSLNGSSFVQKVTLTLWRHNRISLGMEVTKGEKRLLPSRARVFVHARARLGRIQLQAFLHVC